MTSQNTSYIDSRYSTVFNVGRDVIFYASSRIGQEEYERACVVDPIFTDLYLIF
jgi:hypothetical protein